MWGFAASKKLCSYSSLFKFGNKCKS